MTTATEERPLVDIDPRLRARRIAVRRAQGRRRLRRLLAGVVALAASVGAWLVTLSPLLDVDHVVVAGSAHTPADVIARAAAVRPGEHLLYVDTGAVARRVEDLPWVDHVSVVRSWPGTLRIDVIERQPIAAVAAPDGTWRLVDTGGHVVDSQPVRPPGIVVVAGPQPPGAPGTALPTLAAGGLHVAAQLPVSLQARTASVTWSADGTVELDLQDGGVVRLGPADDLPAKFLSALTVLDQLDGAKVRVLDVRAPSAPVLTRGA